MNDVCSFLLFRQTQGEMKGFQYYKRVSVICVMC